MLLAVDIGNTSVHLGVWADDELRATWRLATVVERLPDEYAILLLGLLETAGITPTQIRDCSLSSTVPLLTQTFGELIRRYFHITPLVVGSGVRTGVRILYDNPRDVGPDRIVDAVAAMRLYPPPPLVVVDCGTATVFDAVSREGDYLGGAIAPGIALSAEALFARASRLFRVELDKPKSAIGKNTTHSLQSGIMFGYVGLVQGVVSRFKAELGDDTKVIGTGGYAKAIARDVDGLFDIIDPDLTLKGLRIVYELNHS